MRMLIWFCVACSTGADKSEDFEALENQLEQVESRLERSEQERDALADRVEGLQGEAETEPADQATIEELQTRYAEMEVEQAWMRLRVSPGDTMGVEFQTNHGTIECELWPDKALRTVLNFVDLAEGNREWKDPRTRELVKRPLYNGTTFHRVISGFMIQGGDPLGTGTGGPGYRFDDEPQPGVVFDRPGILAMANAGPNTNGSQFFITDGVPSHLNGRHTIFGGNCESMDVVSAIAGVRADRRNKPVEDVVVQRVRIRRAD